MTLANAGLHLLEPISELELLARLGLAILAGGLIGFERQVERKPAGLRTHMLVSLGSALFVLTGIQTGIIQAEPNTLSRIMQGLIAGIGFLGAGEIFSTTHNKPEVIRIQGLTSAAAIWVSAALGTAAGCGLWFTSLLGSLATTFILWAIKKLENHIG